MPVIVFNFQKHFDIVSKSRILFINSSKLDFFNYIIGYYYLYNVSISMENDVGESDKASVLLRTVENGKIIHNNCAAKI